MQCLKNIIGNNLCYNLCYFVQNNWKYIKTFMKEIFYNKYIKKKREMTKTLVIKFVSMMVNNKNRIC